MSVRTYLFNGGGSLQSVATCCCLISHVTPLFVQGAEPLLDGSLVDLALFGQQAVTSSQNTLVHRCLRLQLRLQNLTQEELFSSSLLLLQVYSKLGKVAQSFCCTTL